MEKGRETHSFGLGMLLRGVWINSGLLFVCSLLGTIVLHPNIPFHGRSHYSWITGSLERGYWAAPDWEHVFSNDAVSMVAMSGILIAAAFGCLWRNGGFANMRRTCAALVALGVFCFAASPFLHARLDEPFFAAVEERRAGTALLLKFLVGTPFSIFPHAGFAFFGAVMGIALARRESLADIRRYGFGAGAAAICSGVVLLALFGVPISPERIGTSLPTRLQLVNLGMMLCLAVWLTGRFEYQDETLRRERARRSVFVRRFGLMAMTIYICESLLCVINLKWFLPLFEGTPAGARFAGLLLFAGMQLGIWYCILRLWERVGFKYSIEWWVVTVGGYLRGRKSTRLDVRAVLYPPAIPAKQND
jgi:hypothetical protein